LCVPWHRPDAIGTCAGRLGERRYAFSAGDAPGLAKADAVTVEAHQGAHVHQALGNDLFLVVRPIADTSKEQQRKPRKPEP
jgi:hypothetical protein